MTDIESTHDGADIRVSAPDAPFSQSGPAGAPLDLPAMPTRVNPALAQLEAWLDAILKERAARDTRE
jgi:hypothetical protein